LRNRWRRMNVDGEIKNEIIQMMNKDFFNNVIILFLFIYYNLISLGTYRNDFNRNF